MLAALLICAPCNWSFLLCRPNFDSLRVHFNLSAQKSCLKRLNRLKHNVISPENLKTTQETGKMEETVTKEVEMQRAHLEKKIQELEAEKKADDRKILELTERELKHREIHTEEIHLLRKRNFEISFEILARRNEIKRLSISYV